MRFTPRAFLIVGYLSLRIFLNPVPVLATSVNVIFYDNRYGVINDSTGAYTQISTLPVGASGGLAAENGMLYLEDFGNNLFSINSVTGAAQLAGNTGLNLSLAVFGGGQNGLFEIDYASNLYSISASTGKASLIGRTGLAANNGNADTSLSTDGTSLLYTAGGSGQNDELYRIDTTTGLATDLGSTGVTGIAGSAVVNGRLELYQYGQSVNYIYSATYGSNNFTRGSQLGAQIVDGGVQIGSLGLQSSQVGGVREPPSALLFLLALSILGAGLTVKNRAFSHAGPPEL